MTGVSFNISPYVHSYEAVKLQKGQEVPKDKQANLIQGDDGEQYMLTDAAKEQMIKDKKAFNDAYMMQSQMATSKANAEAEKKHAEDQAKAMTVYRNMAKGDIVPPGDERRLMEYDKDMYQFAKTAQMMAQNAERKKHKSEWDEDEEREYQEKQNKLNEESNAWVENMNPTAQALYAAQRDAIVEIDAPATAETSSIAVSSGDTGAVLDITG